MFNPQLQALPLLALYYDSDLFSVRADVFLWYLYCQLQ